MDRQAVTRPSLLFYATHADDPHAPAVAPALASAAERAGWRFESYYDAARRGRHFGGGDPERARPGWPSGGLVAGGLHFERVLWLGTRYEVVALGDPRSVLWPALEAAGADALARSTDPAELYRAAFERLGEPVPTRLLVLDRAPQGSEGIVAAPYLYPAFWLEGPALGIDVSAEPRAREALATLASSDLRGLYVDARRAETYPGLERIDGEVGEKSYAELTVELAERHRDWGRGVLLGDPELVAAQLPKASRLRLLPLYGRPQTAVVGLAAETVRRAADPVFGRQYDDRDFFALAELGKSFQLVDPGPPFDAAAAAGPPQSPSRPVEPPVEPSDAELEAWAAEGIVVATVLLWAGMIRESDCLPRFVDLVAGTGLRAGLVLTSEGLAHADPPVLELLAAPPARGGVLGLLEPLLASAGRGVAAEVEMPREDFAVALAAARSDVAARLPRALEPEGWWPLLDAPLVPARSNRIAIRSGRPVIKFAPRGTGRRASGPDDTPARPDARALAARAVHRLGLERLFEEERPFDSFRPGQLDRGIAAAVQAAGFSYMWTKASFGAPGVVFRDGDFVALSLTAGDWEGWSPFYTAAGPRDLTRAEKTLLGRSGPGWLAATVDGPLFALSGEVLQHGSRLYELADLMASGGRSGRLVNVTPRVVARYARLLSDSGRL